MNLRLTSELLARDGLWLYELDGLCRDQGSDDPGPLLVVSMAINALLGWVEDPRAYDGKHANKWIYAIDDFKATTSAIGANLASSLEPELSEARTSLVSLPRTQAADRTNAAIKLKALLAKAGTYGSAVAGWRDLLDACQNPNLAVQDVGFFANQFWDLCRLAELDVRSMGLGWRLSEILADDAHGIAVALAGLGDRAYPKWGEFADPEQKAGMSLADRLALCERMLSSPAPVANNIVWLALKRAGISRATFDYGPIKFFESQWLHGNLFGDGPFKKDLPAELTSPDNHLSEYNFPNDKNTIIARIDMGHRSVVHCIEDAKELLKGVLTLAAPNDRDWILIHGYVHFIDGLGVTTSSFNVIDIQEDYHPHYDPTQLELEQLKTEFTPVVPNANPQLAKVLKAQEWLKRAPKGDPLTELLIYVRAIEQVGSWVAGGGMRWQDFAENYIKPSWILSHLMNEIRDVSYEAVHPSGLTYEDGFIKKVKAVDPGIVEHKSHGYQLHLNLAVEAASALAAVYKDMPDNRKILILAEKLKDGMAISAELDRVSGEFTLLLHRLISCRDSAQHGGPLHDDCVGSVTLFANALARLAVWTAIEAILKGQDIEATLESHRIKAIDCYSDLQAGADPTRLFYS